MIRSREEARAALAEAVALAKAREASATALAVPVPVGTVVVSGGDAETREVKATPVTRRAPAIKRVTKPVTSRGVLLRN